MEAMMPTDEGNSNIQVEITDIHERHCFRLTLNPQAMPVGDLSACCGAPVLEATPGTLICTACAQKCDVAMPSHAKIEIMLHARSLVDLIHKCSLALCDWQKHTTDELLAPHRAAYVDESYPERNCDRCGKPYRGPAVYCSLDCAVQDAR
jgi:hypothetical protein